MLGSIRVVVPLVLAISTLGLPATAVAAHAAASGNIYYVQAAGNDQLDGRTPQSAWKSVNRVNQALLLPGDQVLFNAGNTFGGLLYVPPGRGGTASAPVTFSSYGTGRATINGATGSAFFAYDAAGIVVSNLIFTGSGASTNSSDGIGFYNDMSGGIKLAYVRISNVDVSGFGKSGISIGGWNGSSGFTDVQVTSSSVHGNRRNGLISYGPAFNPGAPTYANSNFYVGHVSAYSNLGDSTLTSNSGNGIVLGSVQGATVERSSAWGNGSLCSATQCGAGIWTYDATGVSIQYNESYSNHSASRVDGDGFDLDQNVSSSYVQYNYSHNNDGAGFLDYSGLFNSAHANNTLRYNISENDSRTNDAAITVGGHVINDMLYDNTVFVSASVNRMPPAVTVTGTPLGVTLRNNILMAQGIPLSILAPAVDPSRVLFQQNDYFASLTVVWGSSIYFTLDSWRAATHQESLGARNLGLTANPALANPGGGGTIGNPDLLVNLSAYRLTAGSPMINVGLDLQSFFGINTGGHDFYAIAVPTGPAPDVGASES